MVMIRGLDFPGVEIKRGKTTNQVLFYKRRVGYIKKSLKGAEFYKPAVDRAKHVYRKHNSVGIEKRLLNALELLRVTRICFQFKGEEGWYKVPIEVWNALSIEMTYCGIVQKQLPLKEIYKFAMTQMFDDHKNSEPPKKLKDFPTAEEIIQDVLNGQDRKLSDFTKR